MNRTPEQIRQSLFALTARGIKYDLGRVSAAAAAIRNPQNICPSFHVAGTNGKGSTCVYIESVLRSAGITTGLFTSPHLVRFEERFRINGAMVDTGEWVEVYHDLERHIAGYRLTFFEATMLMAAELFRRRNVAWAVYETGLGGRLDATNILTPEVAVITRVAMDHREFLGDTLPEVLDEKLGIVKAHVPLVIADPQEPELRRRVERVCADRRAPCSIITTGESAAVEMSSGGVSFVHDGTRYQTRLHGRYQAENALLAIAAIDRAGIGITRGGIQAGITEAAIPARFQRLSVGGKAVILDVAHNPSAVAELCTTLRAVFPDTPVCIVAGIMADKEYPAMLATYAETARHIILTRPRTDRAASGQQLAAHCPAGRCSIVEGVGEAVARALERDENVVCVTGSFFTVGEAISSGIE